MLCESYFTKSPAPVLPCTAMIELYANTRFLVERPRVDFVIQYEHRNAIGRTSHHSIQNNRFCQYTTVDILFL